MSQRQPSERHLNQIERMLERCIEADKVARRERRTQTGEFYEKLKILQKARKESAERAQKSRAQLEKLKALLEEQRQLTKEIKKFGASDDETKH
jgi:hypothetical protein